MIKQLKKIYITGFSILILLNIVGFILLQNQLTYTNNPTLNAAMLLGFLTIPLIYHIIVIGSSAVKSQTIPLFWAVFITIITLEATIAFLTTVEPGDYTYLYWIGLVPLVWVYQMFQVVKKQIMEAQDETVAAEERFLNTMANYHKNQGTIMEAETSLDDDTDNIDIDHPTDENNENTSK